MITPAEVHRRPVPPPGAVHIWCADLGTFPARLALEHLDAAELERARRFLHAADAHRFAAGRMLLRTALRAYLPEAGDELRFAPCPRGKLRLTRPWNEAPLHFSLSHAGEALTVAIGCRRVGVDVERIRPVTDPDAIARLCFSEPERSLLRAAGGASSCELLFKMWTRKEALAKALGAGVGTPLPPATPDFPAGWSGTTLACPAGYSSAVVIEGDLAEVEYVHPVARA